MKKADISITTVIVAALALLVLIVLIAIFTGKINIFSEEYADTTADAKSNVCASRGGTCRPQNVGGGDACGSIIFPDSGGWVDCASSEDCCRT